MNMIQTFYKSAGFAALLLASGLSLAGQKIDQTLATDSDGRVSIDVLSGDVKIIAWDKNEVRVAGELSDEAEGYQFEVTSGRVVFEVEMPKRKWGKWSDEGSNLTFWVPKTNDLRFEGVNVDVEASGIQGGSRLNSVNGDIKVSKLSGRIMIETVNGGIKASDLSGRIKLNTVNGEIVDTNSAGELTIEAVNGEITSTSTAEEVDISNVNGDMNLDFSKLKELEISSVNGDIELTTDATENVKIFISTVGGSAELMVKPSFSARFEVEAHSGGKIRNELSNDRVVKEKYGPGRSLRFETGNASGRVEIGTVNGSVYLKKQ